MKKQNAKEAVDLLTGRTINALLRLSSPEDTLPTNWFHFSLLRKVAPAATVRDKNALYQTLNRDEGLIAKKWVDWKRVRRFWKEGPLAAVAAGTNFEQVLPALEGRIERNQVDHVLQDPVYVRALAGIAGFASDDIDLLPDAYMRIFWLRDAFSVNLGHAIDRFRELVRLTEILPEIRETARAAAEAAAGFIQSIESVLDFNMPSMVAHHHLVSPWQSLLSQFVFPDLHEHASAGLKQTAEAFVKAFPTAEGLFRILHGPVRGGAPKSDLPYFEDLKSRVQQARRTFKDLAHADAGRLREAVRNEFIMNVATIFDEISMWWRRRYRRHNYTECRRSFMHRCLLLVKEDIGDEHALAMNDSLRRHLPKIPHVVARDIGRDL